MTRGRAAADQTIDPRISVEELHLIYSPQLEYTPYFPIYSPITVGHKHGWMVPWWLDGGVGSSCEGWQLDVLGSLSSASRVLLAGCGV